MLEESTCMSLLMELPLTTSSLGQLGTSTTETTLAEDPLEDQAGLELFVRRSKPMKLSPAGIRLLRLAEQILPQVAAVEEEFRAMQQGKIGRLHIAIECHACFEWLLPVLEQFRLAWPDVDVDIRPGLQFEALPALMREEVDLVISSDPEDLPGVDFTPLFDYEPVFVASSDVFFSTRRQLGDTKLVDQTGNRLVLAKWSRRFE